MTCTRLCQVVVVCAVLVYCCTNVRADSGPVYDLSLSLYNDPLCTEPSTQPAVSIHSLTAPYVSDTCSASPAALSAQGYPLYQAMCSNQTGSNQTSSSPYYMLFLWPTTEGGCSMTGGQATLWSLWNLNSSGACTANDVSAFIQPTGEYDTSNATQYTRYSKWSCMPSNRSATNAAPALHSTALVAVVASLSLSLLLAPVWWLTGM